jgi:transposase
MDMGYDNNRVYAECAERDCAAIIPLRRGQNERDLRIPRSSDEWRSLYRRRSAVEREFGRLKHDYGLAFLRVRESSASGFTLILRCWAASRWRSPRRGPFRSPPNCPNLRPRRRAR